MELKKNITHLSFSLLFPLGSLSYAAPITINFDDLAETGFTPVGSFISDMYVGFNWGILSESRPIDLFELDTDPYFVPHPSDTY